MEKINKVFRNGEPLSAEELNGIVSYINELGETIEENQENWSSEGAIEEMWNQLREDDDSKRIHESHSPLHYPLSSINAADLGQPPYSDMTITSDGNGGWQWKKINQGSGGGSGSSSQQGINKQRIYFLNIEHGVVPSAPSINNYNSSPQDNFVSNGYTWESNNVNPEEGQDTYAIWVWFQSNTPVNIDGPIRIFDCTRNSSNGEDGEEIEWIYRRMSFIPSEATLNSWENTLAQCIGNAQNKNGGTFEEPDAVPYDWYDNPLGVTYQEKYEYASFRRSSLNENGKRIWGVTGFCKPFIWSTYGEKGLDGDGIEQIFLSKAEAVNDWLTFSQDPANAINYPPGWTNEQGFQNNEYFGPEGSSWTDDPQGINRTTRRYVYMSQRKKVQDPVTGISSWQAFSIPSLWIQFVNDGINGSYVQEVYRNDTAALLADLSNIPASSNRDYPPTGWTISPQTRSENQYTWCMQRTIEYDEYNISTPGPWGTPFRLTGDNGKNGEDGKYMEFIYKRFKSEQTFGSGNENPHNWPTSNNNQNSPNNPQREDYTGPTDYKWTDNPQGVDDEYLYEYTAQRTFNGTNFQAFSNPILWSKYGENGRDGDGIEYIFKGFSTEQLTWANDDSYPPNWATNSAGFQNDDYLGPSGKQWKDDMISVDNTTNKFVYGCCRKKYAESNSKVATWHAFSAPKLWANWAPQGGQGQQGGQTQFIFKNSSSDLSASGNHNELNSSTASIPNGWSLTATNPSSSERIWGSHRLITYNTSNEAQYGAWVTPYRISGNDGNAVNGGHYEFRYKNYATQPNAPTGTGNTDGWSSSPSTPSASEKYTWMSQTYVSGTDQYGTWSTPIRLTGEDGQPGTDGKSIEFIYTRNNTGTAPSAPATNQTDDWYGTDSNNIIWTDNPQGVQSNLKYEYVSVRYKKNNTWGAYSTPVIWSKWGEKGMDGDGYEYIYKATSSNSSPGNPTPNDTSSSAYQTNGYVPTGWSGDPTSTDSTNAYLWVSVRKKTNGTWGSFSNPALWSHYATSTAGASTAVYQLIATISEIRYKRNHSGVVVWMPSSFDLQLFKFEGTTFNQLNSLPSSFSLSRVIDGTNTASINSLGTITTSTIASYTSGGTSVMGSRVSIKLQSGGSDVTCLNLSIVREYQRMLIPMGAYINKQYTMTDTTIPLVLGSDGKYYYLDADTNRVNNTNIDPTTSGQTVWGEATEYEVILTKALFADFAKLGSFIIYGDYFFSQYGTLYYNNDGDIEEIVINESNYNNQFGNKTPYGWFDDSDPLAGDDPDEGDYKFKPSKGINAKTGEEWSAGGNIYVSSSGNASFSGDINASSFTAGQSNNLHIMTTNNSLQFMRGNTTIGRFVIEGQGLQLYLLDNSGNQYKIDWSKWTSVSYTTHTYYHYGFNNGYVYLTPEYYYEYNGEYYTSPNSNSKITTGSYVTYESSATPSQLYQIVNLVYGPDYSTVDPYARPVYVTELRKVTITRTGPQYGTERLYLCSMVDQMRCDYSDPTQYEIYPRPNPQGQVFVKVGTSSKSVWWTFDFDAGDNAVRVDATIPANRIVVSNGTNSVVYNSYPFGSGSISGMPST